jgi:hypothetical protein
VVLAVLSSRMSAGGCSLAGRRDNVPCLAITAILRLIFNHFFWDATNQFVSVLQPLQFLTISDIFVQ